MKLLYLLLPLIISIAIYSCKDDSVEIEYYKIKIDSLIVADTISIPDTLRIHLHGVIGTDGCYSFYKYESLVTNNTLDLTAWGKHEKFEICTTLLPILDDIYKTLPVEIGFFYINIHQPDGSILKDSVYVR